MRKLTLALLVVLSGCGPSITASSGAAACIVASSCGLVGTSASSCTAFISSINDPSLALLEDIENPIGGGVSHISPAQVNCIASAGTDCAKAKACLDNGMTPAACSGNSNSCMGTFIVSCSAHDGIERQQRPVRVRLLDAGRGLHLPGGQRRRRLRHATCGGGNPTQCMGNIIQGCKDGIFEQVDCATFSSTCVTAGLEAHCRGSGASCSTNATANNPAAAIRCDGSVLVTCSDGQEARYDCGRQNLGCFPNPGGNGGFDCYAGSDCDSTTFTSTCSGNTLTFCNKGKIDTFNCGFNGFTGCDAGAGTCSKS